MPPLDGKQNVSRGTDLYNKLTGTTNEQLNTISFSQGEVLSKNYGTEVPLSKLASDQESYTGPERGFFVQNRELRNKQSK